MTRKGAGGEWACPFAPAWDVEAEGVAKEGEARKAGEGAVRKGEAIVGGIKGSVESTDCPQVRAYEQSERTSPSRCPLVRLSFSSLSFSFFTATPA